MASMVGSGSGSSFGLGTGVGDFGEVGGEGDGEECDGEESCGDGGCGLVVVFLFLELLKSLGLAKVSFRGARKPSVFHTPEPLFVSVPRCLTIL